MKSLFASLLFTLMLLNSSFAQTANVIVGTWLTQDGTTKVKIENTNGKFNGKIVWLNPATDKNGKPVLDTNNSDKALQSRTIMGLPLLRSFVYDGDNLWTDGTIYDPDSGDTYSCNITMNTDGTMNIRGYIGFSLFGRTEIWKRVKDIAMK